MIKRTALSFWICLWAMQAAVTAHAGQVVTDELRAWAAGVIAQEKQIGAVSGEKSVAVMYFLNRTGDEYLDPLQKGMAIMLITDLAKVSGISVVERVRLQAILEELKLSVSGLTMEETSPRIGRLLRAYWIVGGTLEGTRTDLDLGSRVLMVKNGSILGEPGSQGPLKDIFRMEKEILFEIIRLLKVKLEPVEMEELKRPLSTSIDALMAFFRGIDASDRRNYEMAARFYQEAVKKDENLDIAREALEELKRLGLIHTKTRSRLLLRSLKAQTSLTDRLIPEYPVKRMRSPGEVSRAIQPGEPGTGPSSGQPQQSSVAGPGGQSSQGNAGAQPGASSGESAHGAGTQPGANEGGIVPNLPPDYGATVEPSRPATPPTDRPGAF